MVLKKLKFDAEKVIVHDAARPLIYLDIVKRSKIN